MKKIKSFIYLDEYKLYSISSQLFEGLTEYVVHTHSQNQNEKDSQKGPFGSGRIIADIFREEKKFEEKKILYDYAFNLLEDELLNNQLVTVVDDNNYNEINYKDSTFVKVTGKVIFNDMQILSNTVKEFNKIGEALGYLSTHEDYEQQKNEINEQVKSIKDRNQRTRANKQMMSKTNKAFKEYLKESGLTLDDKFKDHLKYILDFGYRGQFEIKVPFGGEENKYLFSSILNRKYLKEDEFELISKYSRKTEKEFTIFGLLTQNERTTSSNIDDDENDEEENGIEESSIMKEAILNLVDRLTDVENTFTGRLSYEYIIDPIAVYREI
jgi:hypothetical protein